MTKIERKKQLSVSFTPIESYVVEAKKTTDCYHKILHQNFGFLQIIQGRNELRNDLSDKKKQRILENAKNQNLIKVGNKNVSTTQNFGERYSTRHLKVVRVTTPNHR